MVRVVVRCSEESAPSFEMNHPCSLFLLLLLPLSSFFIFFHLLSLLLMLICSPGRDAAALCVPVSVSVCTSQTGMVKLLFAVFMVMVNIFMLNLMVSDPESEVYTSSPEGARMSPETHTHTHTTSLFLTTSLLLGTCSRSTSWMTLCKRLMTRREMLFLLRRLASLQVRFCLRASA